MDVKEFETKESEIIKQIDDWTKRLEEAGVDFANETCPYKKEAAKFRLENAEFMLKMFNQNWQSLKNEFLND